MAALDPWQDYRQRRRLMLWAFLAGLALFGLGCFLARNWHSARPFYVGLAVFVGVIAWSTVPLAEFPCPKCGETFNYRGRTRNLFSRKCLHCQHPRWSNPD
jgi:predicted RNA-binding Zn-ribbon protein involved in translation (DUF1610 family)